MTIPDADIPAAAPDAVIAAYAPLVHKMVNRYRAVIDQLPAYDIEDLEQAGMIALIQAQASYNPNKSKFITWAANCIINAVRNTLRFNVPTVSIDTPIQNEDDSITLLDTIPDDSPGPEETATDIVYQSEISKGVHDALGRLADPGQREVLERVYLQGQTVAACAADMGLTPRQVETKKQTGKNMLRRDRMLRAIAADYITPRKYGYSRFINSGMSAVEYAVITTEQIYNAMFGEGAYLNDRTNK